MATPLDREIERLAKEYEEASVMSRTVRAGQAKLISSLTRNSDAVSRSIIQVIQQASTTANSIKLSKQYQELQQKELQRARRRNELDVLELNRRQQSVTIERNRMLELRRKGAARTSAETSELNMLYAIHSQTKADFRQARDVERRSSQEVENYASALRVRTAEIRNMKLTAMADAVSMAAGAFSGLTSAVRKIQQQFGVSADQAASLGFNNLRTSLTSYIDALTGAGPVATIQQIAATQEAFQEQFGGILDPEAAKRLTQEAIKMGVTSQQMAAARRVFMTQTMGNLGQATSQVNKFIGEFKAKGLTAKDAMMAIAQNSELLARNGTRFATAFARAAADAKKIGVDLGKIDQVGDNIIDNFEGFLESQAELGAMGFGFDTSRLAQIAETGDTGALMNELRSQLAMTGKDLTKLRRSEQLALSQAFGIPIAELQRLAGKTVGSGEKTIEQLTTDGNSTLSRIFNVLEGIGKTLGIISTAIAGTIAFSSAATAINTGFLAGRSFLGGLASALAAAIPIAIGAFLGFKGVTSGAEQVAEGNTAAGLVRGAGGGAALAAGLLTAAAIAGIPFTGGTSLALLAGSTALGAGGAYALGQKGKTTGDDVISQPGYGKRSLVTPSGVIALNNRDNIIAYADDLMGTTKLPLGAITSKFKGLEDFEVRANAVFSGLGDSITTKFQGVKQSIGGIFSGITANFAEKGQGVLSKFTGEGSLLGKAKNLFGDGGSGLKEKAMGFASKIPGAGSLLSGGAAGLKEKAMGFAQSKIPGLSSFMEGGTAGLKEKVMGFASKIPGVGSLLGGGTAGLKEKVMGFASKLPGVGSLLGGGGLKAIGTNLLGKVGLSGIAGSLAGGPLTMAASFAAPLLKKIPVVGNVLGSIAEGPGKLIGSAVGKVAGFAKNLFGKKKPSEMLTSMSGGGLIGGLAEKALGGKVGKTVGSIASFASPVGLAGKALGKIGGLFKKKKPTVAAPEMPMVADDVMQANMSQMFASQQPPQINVPPTTVDTSGIEQKLNNFINALQGIQINMDGAKVGKVLVNTAEAATSVGLFRQDARATL